MSIKKGFILIAFIAAIFMAFGFQNSSEHKVLFEKAKFTMETKGDLKGAIKLFNGIVKKYPDEREYAAKSQLYIGLCYEKLGLREAQKAFQKVVDNYPEQQQEVAVAKEKLASMAEALEKVPHKPTFRKILIPTKLHQWGRAILSHDGKKLAFESRGNIWIAPLPGNVSPDIVGEPVKLSGTEVAWGYGLSWSADGKLIAYNSIENNDTLGEIFIIPSSGGKVKKIPVSKDRAWGPAENYRLSLSPDGKVLAFTSKRIEKSSESQENRIYTIPVDGGDAKRLTEALTSEAAFSPDGKKIAYVKKDAPVEDIPQSDVWVISAAGGTPVKIADLPGRVAGPMWSPDGKMIAFVHKAEGKGEGKEICIVPVSETGKPEAAPTKISLPLPTYNLPAGWTSDNKIGLILTNPSYLAIYTVPASGGKASQVSPAGWTGEPSWSPDGKRIYYRLAPEGLASVPAEGGEVSKGPLHWDLPRFFEIYPGGGNDVSPDGEKIVFSGAKKVGEGEKTSYEMDIYTIPVKGGEPTQLTISGHDCTYPCWSPDGKSIAYIRTYGWLKGEVISNIYVIPEEGGEAKQITSESDKVLKLGSYIDWSPDGKLIAYFSKDGTINVIPAGGGEPRVVVKVEDANTHSDLTWSPDGKKIAYTSKGSIWVISSDGGQPVEVKTGLDSKATQVAWSPDGKKIAFNGEKWGEAELWLMEDFLPLVKKGSQREN
jgi:Tol biopolymer transport system component